MPKRSPSSRKETNNSAVNKKPNDIQNVMELKGFKETARSIFDHCKKIVGADGGYVGLLSEDGREMHLLFLDAGRRPCTVDTARPMPIRGLREQAIRSRKAVYCNDLPASEWQGLLPEDLRLLSTKSDQTAIAVQNAQLFEAEREQARRLAAVGEVVRQATSLDLDELLQRAVDLVQQTFGYYYVNVLLVDPPALSADNPAGEIVLWASAGTAGSGWMLYSLPMF